MDADGTTIYAANNENASGNLYELAASSTGVTLSAADDFAGVFAIPNLYIHFDTATQLIYGDDGQIVNPASPTTTPGQSFFVNGIMTPDDSTSTAFFVAHPANDQNVLEYYVYSFNLTTTAPGADLDLYSVQGIPQHLIKWNDSSDGTSGLAFTTKKFNCLYSPCTVGDGRLYVIFLPL